MARRIPGQADTGEATLRVRKTTSSKVWDVYVTVSSERLKEAGFDPETFDTKPVRLITIDEANKRVILHPRYMTPGLDGQLNPKHPQIAKITFDLLDEFYDPQAPIPTTDDIDSALTYMPNGMTRDPNYGLGIKKEYRFILNAVAEMTKKTEVYIGNKRALRTEFKIPRGTYDEIIAEIDRMDQRAKTAEREVKATTAFNMLADIGRVEPRPFNLGRHKIRQLITRFTGDDDFEADEIQEELVSTVSRVARDLVRTNPAVSSELVSEIQISRLEFAVQRYEEMMGQTLGESVWQRFFEADPILLSFAFGYPLTFVNKHPFVGGMDITGKGQNIGDFLYKNPLNNNAALIEIKKPSSPLMRDYRTSAFAPHHELSGGVVQALNQKRELMLAYPLHAVQNKWHGERAVEAFDIDCVLVVGTTPTDEREQRSFQLYRKNSHGVHIVTFDEVLTKLKQLLGYLKGANQTSEQLPSDDF